MIALAGFVLLLLGAALSWETLRRGIYRRIPYEQYAVLGVSCAAGLVAVLEEPTWLEGALLAVEVASLGLLVWYVHWGSVFFRKPLRLSVGERFPGFELPDSRGGLFRSASLLGQSAALYLFYRGDW